MGPTDETWDLLDPLNLPNGDNLVRKFMEQTAGDYGGNWYSDIVEVCNKPDEAHFRPYRMIAGQATFTDFIHGTYIKNVVINEESTHNGQTMMDFKWWRDASFQTQPAVSADNGVREYRFNNQNERSEFFENNPGSYMWDDIGDLASQFLPPQALQFLSARSLNMIIDNLELDFELLEGTERAEIQRRVRRTVASQIDFTKE